MPVKMPRSREFNQDTSELKRATKERPVFITKWGVLAHLLLSIEDYRRLSGDEPSIADPLYRPGAGEIECDPPRARFFLMATPRGHLRSQLAALAKGSAR